MPRQRGRKTEWQFTTTQEVERSLRGEYPGRPEGNQEGALRKYFDYFKKI